MNRSNPIQPLVRKWIFDTEDSRQGFPLKRLLEREFSYCNSDYKLYLKRSDGYGLQVCEWDETLNNQDEIEVDAERIFSLVAHGEEYFYNLDARLECEGIKIRFGMHDSSAMFVESSAEIVCAISRSFSNVKE